MALQPLLRWLGPGAAHDATAAGEPGGLDFDADDPRQPHGPVAPAALKSVIAAVSGAAVAGGVDYCSMIAVCA
jgi:enoyl-CoA hydratase/carnithine racemase